MWIDGRWVTFRAAGEDGGAGGAGAGGAAADWKAALPEDLRGAAFLQDIKDVPTLVKAYGDAQAYRGQSIRAPSPEAGPEARKEFIAKLQKHAPELVLLADGDDDAAKAAREAAWQRLGRPKDAKEYTLDGIEGAEQLNAEELRAAAVQLGLTREQFKSLAKLSAEGSAKTARALTEAQAALRKEWGGATEERLAAAAATALKLGDAELAKALAAGQAAPQLAKMLFAVSKMAGESREGAEQGAGGGSSKLTPSEHRERATEIRTRLHREGRTLDPALYQELLKKLVEHEAGAGA